jgi:glycosyltransferase involved in cell wall biosynthesis
MKQQERYDVVVLFFTYNCKDAIDRSIQSVLDQTFEKSRIKIVTIDNHSDDGTYEKLIEYAKEDSISVYRLRASRTPTRLLLSAFSFLEYVDYKYLLILGAGDELYPNCIEKYSAIMDEYSDMDRRILICETDIKDDQGHISKQVPVFTDNCILLKREHYSEFLTRGVGHKVQCFYCRGVLSSIFPELPFIVDYNDWFKKALFSFKMGCIYIRDSLSCTLAARYEDDLYDLILRLNLVIRLELTRSSMYSEEHYKYFDEMNSRKVINQALSSLALQYALDAQRRLDPAAANKILLFAEMIHEDVKETGLYSMLKNLIECDNIPESYAKYKTLEESVSPPEGSMIIS